MRVMVVDDDEDLLEMVGMMLRANKMDVKTLPNGSLLFETLPAFKPDVLILDVFLGDTDGRQLCTELKQDDRYKDMPVLLYSAGHITADSVMNAGADSFLQKPFDMPVLINRIQTLASSQ